MTRRSLVLCTQMRSGSWLLSDLCQQTGLLGQPEEYFRPDFRGHWSDEWGVDKKHSYAEYITSAIKMTSTPNGVFGVKMHSYQMVWFLRQMRALWGADPEATGIELLEHWLPNPKFVRLKRLDLVRQAISYYRAIHSEAWFDIGSDASRPRDAGGQVELPQEPNWGEVLYLENGLLAHERTWTIFFKRNEIEPLELIYEEVSEDPLGALGEILDLVGVEPDGDLSIMPRLKKQADETTERWAEEYLRHRDQVTPVAPEPPRVARARKEENSRIQPGAPQGTAAPVVYRDRGPRAAELVPADYLEGRVSWAETVASLAMSGLPVVAAAALVDALPGQGAIPERRVRRSDWRKGLTPLPPQEF